MAKKKQAKKSIKPEEIKQQTEEQNSVANKADPSARQAPKEDPPDSEIKTEKKHTRIEQKATQIEKRLQTKQIKAQKKQMLLSSLKRTRTLTPQQTYSLCKQRKQSAKILRTPKPHFTGFPQKKHPIRNTLFVSLGLLVAGFLVFYVAFDVSHWQTLNLQKITTAPQTGQILDGESVFVTKIQGTQNRVVVPLEKIAKHTLDVFIAAEDLRFYEHNGVDVIRAFGALVANIQQGSYAQGASTITMQLIRQSHLSTQKTIARKLEEIYLAWQLEQQMSKDEILSMYLNYIYFGNGAYGIEAAAQTYFDVSASDLSIAQSAALAATIKAPSAYALHLNEANNRSRRTYIIDTMLTEGMIDQTTHDDALSETLILADHPPENLQYGWFIDAVLDEAESILGISSEQVLTGGYTITSTLSTRHQTLLEDQYESDVFPPNASDGVQAQSAAACVDTKTGAVLAIVGGRSYEVRRGFNRATQLSRQPGSALKPLVAFAPAIESFGYTTASVLKDEPTNFNGYQPRNSGYTYYGNVTMRTAMTNSLNVAAVALLDDIGVENGKSYLSSVGIPLDERDSNLSLALGAMTYGVSPVQLAGAYVPFSNGGLFFAPHFISKITDPAGRVLYQNRDDGNRVLSEQSAYLMTSMMQSVTSVGTGAKLSRANTPVAGKTGTVNLSGGGNRDIWMACYNSEIACAFWMGFDQTNSTHKLPGWMSGGDNTATLAANYFRVLYQNQSKPAFTKPDGIVSLQIDTQSIKWSAEAMLAGKLTPDAYRYWEVFASSKQPTKQSDVWIPPRAANRFTVSHNDAGYPLLAIQPSDTAIYRVQRDTYGESFILTELYGTAGETLYYSDTSAQAGVVYTYRVTPVHAELLNNGILLEGMQSVQVAQANLSGAQDLWNSVKNFFTGANSTSQNNVSYQPNENSTSIFWNN